MRAEERPGLTVDNRTNALIVSGNERVFSLVETLITQLDQDLPFEFGEFRVIKLENADAAVVASMLQQIVNTRAQQKAALTAQSLLSLRTIVIPDSRINSIIVGGSSEVFELVEALARQLDTPGISLAGQIRLIPLQHANAGILSSSLNNLFSQRYAATRSADVQRNRPIILPDARINALLVSAGVEDNKALDELLLKLDQKLADPALQIEVIGLQKNDAGRVADRSEKIALLLGEPRLFDERPLGSCHQLLERAPRFDQNGDGRLRLIRIERVSRALKNRADFLAARIARPSELDAFERIALRRWPATRSQVVDHRAAALGSAESLALVLAAALAGDLGIRAAKERVVLAEVDAQGVGERGVVRIERAP